MLGQTRRRRNYASVILMLDARAGCAKVRPQTGDVIMNAKRRFGFSLVELLVVITILAILIGLLMPAVRSMSERSQRSKCASNLRQMVVGFNLYAQDEGVYPQGYWTGPNPWNTISWGGLIQKYWRNKGDVTQCPTATAIHSKKSWTLYINGRIQGKSFGGGGRSPWPAQRVSKTILCGDGHYVQTGLWSSSYWTAIDYQNNRPDFEHNGGSNFLFADGHVAYMQPIQVLQPYLWDASVPEPDKALD